MAEKILTVKEYEKLLNSDDCTFERKCKPAKRKRSSSDTALKDFRIACVCISAALEIMAIAADDGRKPKGKPLPLNTGNGV
jgi:hypothetical protein